MKINKAALDALKGFEYDENEYLIAKVLVQDLINAGILAADPEPELTEPERIAQAARDWVGNEAYKTFEYASGWSTQSWETVLGEKDIQHNIRKLKDVFLATVILAKEAGVEL